MDDDELYAEVLDQAQAIVELSAPQLEGWASGLFTLWVSDSEALGFVEYCSSLGGAAAAALTAALALVGDGEVAKRAARVAVELASDAPPIVALLGASRPTEAWEVRARFGRWRVVVFRCGDAGRVGESSEGEDRGDDSDHAVLVELDADGRIADLQLAGSPGELLAMDFDGAAPVEIVSRPLTEIVAEITTAWDATVDVDGEAGPGLAANQRLVRYRLEALGGDRLPLLQIDHGGDDLTRGMTGSEIAEADAAARSTLLAALGHPPEVEVEMGWIEVVRGSVEGLTSRERQALLWLEWADWLGAGIGLVRAGTIAGVSGTELVDHVNRCPEVSSTIAASDREYAIWAFEIAVEHLVDCGLSADGRLTDRGQASLHRSLHEAWRG